MGSTGWGVLRGVINKKIKIPLFHCLKANYKLQLGGANWMSKVRVVVERPRPTPLSLTTHNIQAYFNCLLLKVGGSKTKKYKTNSTHPCVTDIAPV